MSGNMINKKIGIIDYGASNIFNLVNAFEHLNVNVKVIDEPQDMSEITHLVLPGVGAFENGMNSIKNKNLTDLILGHVEKDLPFLSSSKEVFKPGIGLPCLFQANDKQPPWPLFSFVLKVKWAYLLFLHKCSAAT